MVPFILLGAVYGALTLLAQLGVSPGALRSRRVRARAALGAMFLMTGVTHFTATQSFLLMVPEVLPLRREAIYLSGAAELAGAAGLLHPRLRRAAGVGLAVLLLAVFPANVNVAVHNVQVDLVPGSPAYQWGRLLLQPLLIWMVLWSSEAIRRPVPSGAVRTEAIEHGAAMDPASGRVAPVGSN